MFLIAPFAYVYISLIVLRELCVKFPETIYHPIQQYLPILANVVSTMKKSSIVVEVWCWIEAVFFILLKLKIKWLQLKDPLEASLSSAPMMELEERSILWKRMMDSENDNPVLFVSGWFFDHPIENISRYDIRDFLAWSLFEGRNQEHLTGAEVAQLDECIDDLERRITRHMLRKSASESSLETPTQESGTQQTTKQGECTKVHNSIRFFSPHAFHSIQVP